MQTAQLMPSTALAKGSYPSETLNDPVATLLQSAEQIAKKANTRLTPLRRHIYKCLLQASQPLGAYEILDMLDGAGSPKPPTVYRSLEWLLELGLIRKVSSVSKFVALPKGQSFDPVAVLLCRDCGKVGILEADPSVDAMIGAAKQHGFENVEATVEILGKCASEH